MRGFVRLKSYLYQVTHSIVFNKILYIDKIDHSPPFEHDV